MGINVARKTISVSADSKREIGAPAMKTTITFMDPISMHPAIHCIHTLAV